MLTALTLVVLLAEQGRVTLPRMPDPQVQGKTPAERAATTDPLFDRARQATDDGAFVLSVVESLRQGLIDARAAGSGLSTPALRAAAAQIGELQRDSLDRLERLAREQGWRLPEGNPVRTGSVPVESPVRTAANFIIHQIAYHENLIGQMRAQVSGPGNEKLKQELRRMLPGYQKNLQMLLALQL